MSLTTPADVMARLADIENDLMVRQNDLEQAARDHFQAKREKEHNWACAFVQAQGTDGMRRALAQQATALTGALYEADYEAQKAACRVLETRANVLMAILKAQSRV
jgi:hypothetical protein